MTMHNKFDPTKFKVSCRDCNLYHLCLPRGLAEEELVEFERLVTPNRPLQAGKCLYQANDPFKSIFAVKSGSMKSVVSTADGEEQIVGFHLPGELVGFDGLHDDRHTCAVWALEPSTYCEMSFSKLGEFCARFPSLQRELYHMIGGEMSMDQSMLVLMAKRPAEERFAMFLLSVSRRLASRGFSEAEFFLTMSRFDLANYLGLAVETVSRLFRQFMDEGLLEVERKRIRILDLERFRAKVSTTLAEACAQ